MKMPEYHAVVLAGGRGSRMTELTNTVPKCLLPVANLPMIVYPLHMLQNANFQEALVIVTSKCLADVKRVIADNGIQMKIDLIDIPDDDDLGTAEALRLISHKISKNALIISGDFVTDFNLNKFIDNHEIKDASVSVLLAGTSVQGLAPGPKSKKKSEKDLIGIEPSTNRLVFMCGEADLEEDTINLHRNLLVRFPTINFSTKLTDCHVYIINKCILDLLTVVSDMNSLKADLLPFVINLQQMKWPSIKPEVQSVFNKQDSAFLVSKIESQNRICCSSYVMTNEEFTICARMNTVGSYFEANKQIPKILPKLNIPLVSPSISAAQHGQIGNDSILGSRTSLGDKSQVKRSIIGKHCALGDKCKINNSLIMDHVRVGEGSTLTNCIICHSAEIGDKCELKDCFVGTNQRVQPSAKLTADLVGEGNKMMEI